ncbi:MAG: HAMP domain-containing protein [Planctomycetales bacterium]|nr:HAMP domain-containing protein [Planctomycetales bacterium]
MHFRLKDMPIRLKLTLLVQLAVAVALAVASGTLLLMQWQAERTALLRQLSTLADVMGANTAASLVFDDDQTAAEFLGSLRMLPGVEAAWINNSAGQVFASYTLDGANHNLQQLSAKTTDGFTDTGLALVSSAISSDGDAMGTIYVTANQYEIWNGLTYYAVILGGVVLTAFISAYVMTAQLQRSISGPILSLAQTAERVTAKQDYSIRVKAAGRDELGTLYNSFNRMLEQVETSERALQAAHDELEQRVEERTRQLSEANSELSSEVAERRRAEEELKLVHREFVDAARRAGMAEIASGVLHNVGNVLNSVNVSASTISNRLKSSKRCQLNRMADLLDEHSDDIGDFMEHDEKGRQVPRYLRALADNLQAEEKNLADESASLLDHIEHIKAIIATQQSYAGTSGLVEPISIANVLDDAVKLNATSFDRHGIQVVRDLADVPEILVDKQRLLQIVTNLIKNAKEAFDERVETPRILTLRTEVVDEKLQIQVSDTGVGIATEELPQIFTHGFTTKTTGHGFGLHSCANAAREMDGDLRVSSEGRMKGATFTLTLPYTPLAATAT